MRPRFYLPNATNQPVAELTGSEAHHLLHVLRRRVGETVELFDGRGNFASAAIASTSRNAVELKVNCWEHPTDDVEPAVILGTAIPKGERFRWLVEKATELGVRRLVPLTTEHSVVEPGTGKLDKMQQTVIAACKQCRRNRLLEIDSPTSWQEFIAAEFGERRVYVADPQGKPCHTFVAETNGEPIVLAVGPEGGFTEDELRLATDAGAKFVSLGSHILRVETAAVALASLFGCRETASR